MQKLTCLIIEDEPIAAAILQDYIQEVSFLELKGICKDAIFALEKLNQEAIDVIFLDIHLPKLKGLEFLKTLTHKPQTILTTAYHEYTLQAFEEGVVDYLMKPIEFSRFLKAVNKLEQKENLRITPIIQQESKRAFRFFNINKKKVKVYYDEVLYIESLKDYSRIFTSTTSLVTRGQIGEMEQLFQEHGLLRIHRSFIVALDKIKAYSTTEIEIEGKSLPIGRSYKELVAKRLEAYFTI